MIIFFQILHVTDENQGFNKHTLSKKSAADRGRKICLMSFENIHHFTPMPYCHFESEALEIFAKTQQVTIYYVLIFINMHQLQQ